MTHPLEAVAPQAHATVMAAAGTGKTWLLVTRVVRLLLAGARPEGILAITFTRKAAAEMVERLHDRLHAYAGADDKQLNDALRLIGLEPNDGLRARARRLYEGLLASPRPPRMTTFHAFCQEVLQRFPLEADIPPGFELVDTAGLLEHEAWDALYQEATQEPDGALGRALEELFDGCGGLDNTQKALTSFLHHRSDWWAFTDGAEDPVAHGVQSLLNALQIDPERDHAAEFFGGPTRADLQAFSALLARHDNKTNRAHADRLGEALGEAPGRERLEQLQAIFFTGNGQRRSRKPSKAQQRSLGAEGEARLLALHEALCERLEQVRDRIARAETFALTRAWYRAGQRLVEHFQRIKRERRWLDFTDLEWTTYRLLSDAENAHWVQYKLDRRIDHILVDEFQDTNPTQWQLLLPLLEELAAGAAEHARSVFLVGDDKQSIYGFRRADPRLLHSAGGWLRQRLGALTCSLDRSRRSSPAIIECVNAIFARPPLAQRIASFQPHGTHRKELWGRVELLPLVRPAGQEEHAMGGDGLRDPLLTPRAADEERRHYEEGRAIAAGIGRLVADRTPIVDGSTVRPLRYGDVFILLRKRTPALALEQALRDADIPYLGAGRGALLESLEVSDMEALLNTLISPYDNLALAQVLRSPVFAADDADLVRLVCAGDGPWRERLAELASGLPDDHPLHRAHRLLASWEALAGRIPVHDLLDRIYSEADLSTRYEAAFPRPLRPRVHANLARFIELALEVDSGRYPTLPRFLGRLQQLKRHALEAPDEPPALGGEDRVRIMTVHGAKGLEAPVVWLADAACSPPPGRAFRTLVDWPAEAPHPAHFLLVGRKDQQDSVSRSLLEAQAQAQAREDANLLYVALTRARQYLFISASEPGRGRELGWYGQLREGLEPVADAHDGALVIEHGRAPPATPPAPPISAPGAEPDPRLSRPLSPPPADRPIAPSRTVETLDGARAPEEDGRPRGIAIHRMLELATSADPDAEAIVRQVAGELGMDGGEGLLNEWWEETQAVLRAPACAAVFAPGVRAHNEVPVQYEQGGRLVYGLIDRLVVGPNEVLIVDYKTHREARPETLEGLAAPYAEQLRLYTEGVRRIWPGRTLRPCLLFTACQTLCELALE